VEILEIHEEVKSNIQLIAAYPKLLLKHIGKDYDVMIIPRRGIMTLPLANIIKKGPIIHFQYVPIYDSFVNDREKFKKNSIRAKLVHFLEKMACKMSDVVVLDSYEACKFVSSEYNLDIKKFKKFFWGTDENNFKSLAFKKPNKVYNVFYFGTFIPFHGVDVLVETSRILSEHKDIQFTLCGDGQTKKENEKLSNKYGLKNIHFLGHVDFSIVKENLKNSDVCIGILGNYKRRTNTAPNKIFETLASQKPLITRDTPAMKELHLQNMENCILIQGGEPQELAKAILLLKNNSEISEKIARNGYNTFKKITSGSWNDFWTNTLYPLFT